MGARGAAPSVSRVSTRNPHWHALDEHEAIAALDARPDGLTAADAQARLARFGPNRLPEATGPSAARLLFDQVRTPLMWALLAAGALALALGRDRGRPGRARRRDPQRADRVRAGVPRRPRDRRAGRAGRRARARAPRRRVGRDPGRGRSCPATCSRSRRATASRPTSACSTPRALRAQEAALTGESEPVDKAVAAVAADAPLAERRSLLYAGTVVAAGSGRGVTVATGTAPSSGGSRRCSEASKPLETPLTRDLARFGRVITAAIGVAAVAARGRRRRARASPSPTRRWPGSASPSPRSRKGLPAVVTIALAVGRAPDGAPAGDHPPPARGRDARRDDRRRLRQDRHADAEPDARRSALDAVPATTASCGWPACSATTRSPGLGDPTETALLDAAGLDVDAERAAHPRLAALPFDAARS